jgi:hypothetical protein
MNLLDNKYSRWYYAIISKAQAEGRVKSGSKVHYDRHHIIPTSLGGSNERSNKVWLTSREHFICHILLMKCTEGKAKMSMACAWNRMATSKRYGSKQYEFLRNQYRQQVTGENNPFFGKTHDKETIDRIRLQKIGRSVNKGAYRSPENRFKISESLKGRKNPATSERQRGKTLSAETRKKISEAGKGRIFSMESREKIRQAAIAQWARQKSNLNVQESI